MVKIAPSLLSADYRELARQIALSEKGGADMFHIDVMDGHFVPNITVGPVVVTAVRRCTKLPLDVHLMIQHPERLIKAFSDAGADDISVHIEAEHDMNETLNIIMDYDKSPGLVLNPPTPLEKVVQYLDKVDILLIMTVNPGFAGQKFIPEVLPKIKAARKLIDKEGLSLELQVDGGIDTATSPLAAKAGADILVAGSGIFGGDIIKRIRAIRHKAETQGL